MVAGLKRLAAVDIGTNSVLLLVAEKGAGRPALPDPRGGGDHPAGPRAWTAPGCSPRRAWRPPWRCWGASPALAREAGAERLVVTATSAARDARNGEEFLRGARERTGTSVEILSGDEEARLGYLAVAADFAERAGPGGLLAIDVGGGSTEFVHGTGTTVRYRTSLDIGSVRLTERCIRSDPPSAAEQQAVRSAVEEALAALPAFPETVTVVGVAGTVTSLFAVAHGIEPYDAARVHRGWLTREEVALVRGRLCSLSAGGAAPAPGHPAPPRRRAARGGHPLRDRAGPAADAGRLGLRPRASLGCADRSLGGARMTTAASVPTAPSRVQAALPGARYALGVLTFINLLNYLDRYIVSGVIPRHRGDLRHRPRPGRAGCRRSSSWSTCWWPRWGATWGTAIHAAGCSR